jgi:hypothetical protein
MRGKNNSALVSHLQCHIKISVLMAVAPRLWVTGARCYERAYRPPSRVEMSIEAHSNVSTYHRVYLQGTEYSRWTFRPLKMAATLRTYSLVTQRIRIVAVASV